MEEGLEVSWVPSYGPEMRGGTANCTVILSDERIGSPLVEAPSEIIVMNRAALHKFEPEVVPGGTVFVNSSIVPDKVSRKDLKATALDSAVQGFHIQKNQLGLLPGKNLVDHIFNGLHFQRLGGADISAQGMHATRLPSPNDDF